MIFHFLGVFVSGWVGLVLCTLVGWFGQIGVLCGSGFVWPFFPLVWWFVASSVGCLIACIGRSESRLCQTY